MPRRRGSDPYVHGRGDPQRRELPHVNTGTSWLTFTPLGAIPCGRPVRAAHDIDFALPLFSGESQTAPKKYAHGISYVK
jgi:hypothetical protein